MELEEHRRQLRLKAGIRNCPHCKWPMTFLPVIQGEFAASEFYCMQDNYSELFGAEPGNQEAPE